MPSRRLLSRGKRLLIRVARDSVAFLAVVSTLVALFLTTLGPRRSVLQARLAASSPVPAACSAGNRAEPPGKELQSEQLLAERTDCESPNEGDDSNGSQAGDSADDQDDDNDSDEMLVQRLEHALGTSFFELLWHETTRLSGVIHSPEPPPARRA